MAEETTEVVETTDDTKDSTTEDTSLLASDADTSDDTDKGDDKTTDKDSDDKKDDTLLTKDPDKDSDDKTDDKTDDKDDDTDGAPEKYEAFELPEGVESNAPVLEKLETLAREQGMNQEQAQKFVGLGVEVLQDAATAQQKQWDDTQTAWRDEFKADKDFGGSHLNESIVASQRVLDIYGCDDLKAALSKDGVVTGNHPALIKMLVRIDKATREDSAGSDAGGGGTENTEPPTLANTVYKDGGDSPRKRR